MAIGAAEKRRKTAAEGLKPSAVVKEIKSSPGPDKDGEGANGVLPEHAFQLRFVDQRGHRWSGEFKTHVLTYQERIQVGLVRARLGGNIPPDALDGNTRDLLEMISHLTVCLDSAPDWASPDQLIELYDPRVVGAIYEEVASHEARFFGAGRRGSGASPDPDPEGSPGAGVVPEDDAAG